MFHLFSRSKSSITIINNNINRSSTTIKINPNTILTNNINNPISSSTQSTVTLSTLSINRLFPILLSNSHSHSRSFSSAAAGSINNEFSSMRNFGISAHIDSGKTTLTERILYYTGKIHDIHEVKGKDSSVGATMDHMELEREKGLTITSAATHCNWNNSAINIIDTPGHVDFTIEVERSLRVLDGAIMVLCSVAGVQSQSLTVDRQMKRYSVPRVVFINKLDRSGANPNKGIDNIRSILRLNAAALQIPIGLESSHIGVIDLINLTSIYFDGDKGELVRIENSIPDSYKSTVIEKRKELIERIAEVDEQLGELFMNEQEPTVEQLKAAIRRATISMKFVPVFMGSAFKNKGVQPLLDGVVDYLPAPNERSNYALDQNANESKTLLLCDSKKPFVALAFKLEERPFGQLTYTRIYQGMLRKGDYIYDVVERKRVKIQRLVKMHANQMEDVSEAGAGEIIAMFGIDCASGTTFTSSENIKYTMTSMHVPEPVISLSITPKNMLLSANFAKALNRFVREDPTFRVHTAKESQETIISGMGELHLEIYIERMKREYKVETIIGQPKVNYRETCTNRAQFNYTHKKQSGGAGQYGKVVGYIEPIEPSADAADRKPGTEKKPEEIFQFVNKIIGNVIPPEFYTAIEKGFREAIEKGLAGYPVEGVRVVLEDGASHSVDSNEIAFRLAAQYAFREAIRKANPIILEPIMDVEIEVPTNFQGGVVANINRRKGMIQNVEAQSNNADFTVIRADVPLSKMFGYSTDLRSSTEGKGEFSMEYKFHSPISREEQNNIMEEYEKRRLAALKEK